MRDGRVRECAFALNSIAYRVFIFHQALVVPVQTNQKQDTRHVLETVDPFPSFALLASHVDHDHLVLPEVERRLYDTCRPGPTPNNILLRRLIERGE